MKELTHKGSGMSGRINWLLCPALGLLWGSDKVKHRQGLWETSPSMVHAHKEWLWSQCILESSRKTQQTLGMNGLKPTMLFQNIPWFKEAGLQSQPSQLSAIQTLQTITLSLTFPSGGKRKTNLNIFLYSALCPVNWLLWDCVPWSSGLHEILASSQVPPMQDRQGIRVWMEREARYSIPHPFLLCTTSLAMTIFLLGKGRDFLLNPALPGLWYIYFFLVWRELCTVPGFWELRHPLLSYLTLPTLCK